MLADRFVTGSSADGWVRVHDSKTGEEREVYKGHHGPVHAISYVGPRCLRSEPGQQLTLLFRASAEPGRSAVCVRLGGWDDTHVVDDEHDVRSVEV